MEYVDIIYGKTLILDPVIIELINSKPIRRLKGIEQAGYHDSFFPNTAYTRFEHSVGVYLLLKKYGAPLAEQVSGLIHDASHATFSHCIDYVLDNPKGKTQSHQDDIFDEFVTNSEIPSILEKYNMDTNYILDDSNFPLKEKKLPDLCADRIDYALRTIIHYEKNNANQSINQVKRILDKLLVKENKWVFSDFETAKDFAETFAHLNKKYYSGIQSAVMHHTVGECLKYALSKNYISKEDLYETDAIVLSKIVSNLEDKELRKLFARMNNKTKYKNDPKDYDSIVYCKSRIVDPLFIEGNKILRFSEKKPEWKETLKQESKPKEYFLKFMD